MEMPLLAKPFVPSRKVDCSMGYDGTVRTLRIWARGASQERVVGRVSSSQGASWITNAQLLQGYLPT
jgi:hypothetical protein